MKVGSELINNLGSPALLLLPLQDVAADLPIQQHQFAVDRKGGAELGLPDAFFQAAEEASGMFDTTTSEGGVFLGIAVRCECFGMEAYQFGGTL